MTPSAYLHDHVVAADAKFVTWTGHDSPAPGSTRSSAAGDHANVANRFTPADLVPSTLSINVPGWVVIKILEQRTAELSELLAGIPTGVSLHEATDQHLEAVYKAHEALDSIDAVGHGPAPRCWLASVPTSCRPATSTAPTSTRALQGRM